jgi:hypothetical protein
LAIAILTLLFASCAGPPLPSFTYPNGTDSEGRPRPLRFLTLPCNVAIPLPEVLESAENDVMGALVAFLRNRGDSIEIFPPERAHNLWRTIVAEVERSTTLAHGYESARQVFVSHISASSSFDVLIMPTLVYRDTEIIPRQRQVKWDGVIRRYQVVNYSDKAKRLQLAPSITPVIPGVSFYLVLLSPDGTPIFRQYGGLDITHDVDLANSEFTMTSDLVRRERILVDTEYLKEGIAVAFDPYLPRD